MAELEPRFVQLCLECVCVCVWHGTLNHSSPWCEGEACLRSPKAAAEDQLIVVSQQSLGDLSVTPRKRGNICSVELCGGACWGSEWWGLSSSFPLQGDRLQSRS